MEVAMAFPEVRVFEIREIVRLWLRGEGFRSIERLAQTNRKTVHRYIDAAVAAGVDRAGGEEQLTDAVMAVVCEAVRPHRPRGRGGAWEALAAHHDQLKQWLVDDGLTAVRAGELLARRGVVVPERTLHRYALEMLDVGRSARRSTVPVADGEPGAELQVDFGRMGLIFDSVTGRRRVCWALIFTAVYSRHCFVWLSFNQTTETVIAGFEAAWAFFGGVFRVVIPDNMSSAITTADQLEPRFNQAFIEYAQTRGFVVDPARVRKPQDKAPGGTHGAVRAKQLLSPARTSSTWPTPSVERPSGAWSGRRIHGTHACRPVELFETEEKPRLLPAPADRYDLPLYVTAKVHRDHHIEVARALYSIPGNLIGSRVDVRADSALVRVFYRGALIKIHPRQAPGGRVTDADDLPADKTVCAMRDLDHLRRLAAAEGPAIGAYTDALLDTPLPWTKMRQVYALLGLVKRWGAPTVEAACARALETEVVSVPLIGRMIERATENQPTPKPHAARSTGRAPRFARDPGHFATHKPSNHKENPDQQALEIEGGVA
jgi:hypothetical protein